MFNLFQNIHIDWLGKRKIFIAFSVFIMLAGLASTIGRQYTPGGTDAFNLGVDFKGGTVVVAKFRERPADDDIRAALHKTGIADPVIQSSTDKPDEALTVIDALPSVTGQSDRDRATLLRARILEDLKRNDEALALYGDIAERVPGDEARCRYAALLLKVGKKAEARRVLEDVEHRMKYIDRHSRVENAPMYDWAMKELSGLRT